MKELQTPSLDKAGHERRHIANLYGTRGPLEVKKGPTDQLIRQSAETIATLPSTSRLSVCLLQVPTNDLGVRFIRLITEHRWKDNQTQAGKECDVRKPDKSTI